MTELTELFGIIYKIVYGNDDELLTGNEKSNNSL